ncbi:hypothetical protein [Acinetobacter harbinensis]|uniref:hypothetical protein n=1 Tax=Acinetobacter harbinensis TaxID=1353941 RepID=UPI001C4E9EF4|nr:hypothetical protein [Acinetobacter harbinensis]
MTRTFIFLFLMIFQVTDLYAQSVKPAWYRYYDSRGIANISTNVTPNHIRYGYEALDQNMQVIQRNRAYNSEVDIKQAPQRAALAKKNEADLKLKKAYSNSQVALQKRNDALLYIKKQIAFQQEQLKQLQNDRIYFKRQQLEHLRKGETVPVALKNKIDYNQKNIEVKKELIVSLHTQYDNTQLYYDKIIARLKLLE